MSRQWTEEQKTAISFRGGNLLVSAAAGSGKTAVLVERILEMVTDPAHPVDIDRLLVVTFTRAAAGEMKERLSKALTERLEEHPDDRHLQEQTVLIHHAEITTIHGFCTWVIQNYYQRIGIDPGYRIAEEGELSLLRADVLSEMLEDEYKGGSEDFLRFIEAYAPGKSDAAAEELILKVYDFSMSHPDPDGWLAACVGNCEVSSDGDLSGTPWMRTLLEDARLRLQGAADRTEASMRRAEKEGLDKWADVLADDLDQIRTVLKGGTYSEMAGALAQVHLKTWPQVTAKVKASHTEEQVRLLAEWKESRPRELVKKLREDTFSSSEEQIRQDLSEMKPYMEELTGLVREFGRRFGEKKREKCIADFSDLEHMALQILTEKTADGRFVRTDAAREIAAGFEEVIVDEYQDSNYLQETILRAVSGEEDGRPDRFMVGDMKQSIYGFRMARPSLFLDKFNRYQVLRPAGEKAAQSGEENAETEKQAQTGTAIAETQGQTQTGTAAEETGDRTQPGYRIDLSKNFRSRAEVLNAANAFFGELMIPELGGIRYDEAQRLYYGAGYYPESPDRAFPKAELLLINRENPDFSAWQTRSQRMQLEAAAVAARIRRMVGREQIYDRDLETFRPLRYRDCAVLLRVTEGWSDAFVKTLQDAGVPAYSVSRVGYFSAQEIVTVLNYLSIIDNPKQDIAVTGILRSPMVGCSDSELAEIRAAFPDRPFFEAVKSFAGKYAAAREDSQAGEREPGSARNDSAAESVNFETARTDAASPDAALGEKLSAFLRQLQSFRDRVPYTPVHELIEQVLEETGYGACAAAMPAGQQRAANLKMLIEKAVLYEKTSYHGLFNFIRYIDRLKKYQIDYGEVNVSGEAEDIVRVMSIHMSKGLEFPVVFVSGLSRNFNQTDARKPVVMHADLGIGMELIDPLARTKKDTILRTAIRKRLEQEDKGEELRVLYVAMTRAEEKLILTGMADKSEDIEKVIHTREEKRLLRRHLRPGEEAPHKTLDYNSLIRSKSCLDWIEAAVPDEEALSFHEVTAADIAGSVMEEKIRVGAWADAVQRDAEVPDPMDLPEAGSWNEKQRANAKAIEAFLGEKERYVYPYAAAAKLPSKLAVTEIRQREAAVPEEESEDGAPLIPEEPVVPYIPSFIQQRTGQAGDFEDSPAGGAARGTVYHHFLQSLRYEELPESEEDLETEIRRQIAEMTGNGLFSEEEAACLRPRDFIIFLKSEIGRRMRRAAGIGNLHREQPFVIDIPAKVVDTGFPENENILVQGIMDAYFSENGKWILVDYKTDRVSRADGRDLAEKYKEQLRYYKEALERITGRKTAEIWLYSFSLGRQISVPV